MTTQEIREEALSRAQNPFGSASNYATIINGFTAKGIPEDQIIPRQNVFTFTAWQALGRVVRKGEHGIKVCTFIPMSKVDEVTGKVQSFSRPRSTTVFHISQTDAIGNKSEVARPTEVAKPIERPTPIVEPEDDDKRFELKPEDKQGFQFEYFAGFKSVKKVSNG